MKKITLFLISLCICFSADIHAQGKRSSIPLKHGAHRIGKRTDPEMQRWREHGLGQFIHWGLYSIPGGFWKGQYYDYAAEQIRSWDLVPNEEYDNLCNEFNPITFDARKWARQAKEMGARYLIFTTKHHDGFCMWPSKYTDFTIANSPYKKDIVKQVVDAYNREGIDVILYFSIMDWHHPDFRGSINNPEDSLANERFKQFTRNQLLELVTNYPTLKGLWFDGTWHAAWKQEAEFADNLEKELRILKPDLIIGSRFRPDDYGKRGTDSNGDLMGDYEQGWERDLPNSKEELYGNDWDCVMTIPENQWGYHSEWKGYVKTAYDLIEMLVKSVSMDGNFVLNFGPDSKGNIRPEETRIAGEIGKWMKTNNEAIYACTASELKPQGWGYFTQKENKLYLTVFNRPINNRVKFEVPKGTVKIRKAYLLADKREMDIIDGGRNKKDDLLYQIAIPKGFTPDQPFVIVIELEDNRNDKNQYQQALT